MPEDRTGKKTAQLKGSHQQKLYEYEKEGKRKQQQQSFGSIG